MDWDAALCRWLWPSFQAESGAFGLCLEWWWAGLLWTTSFSGLCCWKLCFIEGIALKKQREERVGWVGLEKKQKDPRKQTLWSLHRDGVNPRPPQSFEPLFEVSGAVSFGRRWHWGFNIYSVSPTWECSPITWESWFSRPRWELRSLFLARSQENSSLDHTLRSKEPKGFQILTFLERRVPTITDLALLISRAWRDAPSGFIFFGRIYTFEFVILSSELLPRSRSFFLGM